MSSAVNLYATRVFAEHPLSLWALDENVGYISLLPQSDQDLSEWEIDGATAVDIRNDESFTESPIKEPFSAAFLSGIIEDSPNNGLITLTSSHAINQSDISFDLGSFSIGFYLFTFDRAVQVRLGYSYTDTVDNEEYEVVRLTNIPVNRRWAFVSETFSLPQSFSDLKIVIEFSYQETDTPYELAINGISWGQWSEEFHTSSLGTNPSPLPESVPIEANAVEAFPYGLQGRSGYYLVHQNVLRAKNSGLPLVFGSSNSTVIFPNPDKPSVIVPGFGFLNQSGQYQSLTSEFWINIQSKAVSARRFFGPIGSEDGLYVEGPFIKMKVGENIGSHFVGEWSRPMLVNMRLSSNACSLLINGEEVISLQVSPETVSYPARNVNGKDFDWLGFYAYPDVPTLQIDSVGIYPYEVPAIVQKRRWVYGQGVDFPASVKGSNPSNTTFIDYSVANYAKNYLYPQIGRWRDGFSENLVADKKALALPEYELPQISFNNKNSDEWLEDLEVAQPAEDMYLSLNPNTNWSETDGYLLFKNLNFLRNGTKAVYAVFEKIENSLDPEILFYLHNEITETSISVISEGTSIKYLLEYKDRLGEPVEEIFYETFNNEPGQTFFVGFDIQKVSAYFGKKISSFFGTRQNIKVYVGGSRGISKSFSGKIYRVGFATPRNLKKISHLFNDIGLAKDYENIFDFYINALILDAGDNYFGEDSLVWNQVLDGGDPFDFDLVDKKDHIASYTLRPRRSLGVFGLDIAADSYWEDYVPLSYFGKFVTDINNRKFFTLDFLQLNVDYPKFEKFMDGKYDTEGAIVKTYVSFQFLKSGANANFQNFTSIEPLPSNGIVRPGGDFLNKKYEVLNDTIIYPPKGININNLALVLHVEIQSEGILADPIKIRSLEVASQALNLSPNRIETRFGSSIIPFKKYGNFFDYKFVNPYSIYKKTSPYLYLTSNSGMRMRGEYLSGNNNGLSIPINRNRAGFFKVNMVQMALKYDEPLFPIAPVQIFEIQANNDYIKFYLVADSNSRLRGQIYAINDRTQALQEGIVFYIDGNVVKRPIVNLSTWSILGLSFEPSLDFSFRPGAIRFTSPILFNTVSYYQNTEQEEAQRAGFRKWFAVRSEPDNPLTWGYWAGKTEDENGDVFSIDSGFTWREVLFLNTVDPDPADASQLYRKYVGTDRFIVDGDKDVRLSEYTSKVYKDVVWKTITVNAV
jgi:hypothetical protein